MKNPRRLTAVNLSQRIDMLVAGIVLLLSAIALGSMFFMYDNVPALFVGIILLTAAGDCIVFDIHHRILKNKLAKGKLT
jgi:hypothetical protein